MVRIRVRKSVNRFVVQESGHGRESKRERGNKIIFERDTYRGR